MWRGLPIESHPVPIETPGQGWIIGEPPRTRQSDEIETELLVRRIGVPESLSATEIRQAAVDPHARAGPYQQRIGRRDRQGGAVKSMVDHQGITSSWTKPMIDRRTLAGESRYPRGSPRWL